jgi:hypothetical protein
MKRWILLLACASCSGEASVVGTWLPCETATDTSAPTDDCHALARAGVRFTSDGRMYDMTAQTTTAFTRDSTGVTFSVQADGTYDQKGSHVDGNLAGGDAISFDLVSHGSYEAFTNFKVGTTGGGTRYMFHFDTNGARPQ